MIPSKRRILKHLAKLFDLCVLVTLFVCAGVLAYSSPRGLTFSRLMGLRITLGDCLLFALLLLSWHVLFNLCGLYISKRLTRRRVEALEVCKATSLACALLLLSARIFHIGIVNGAFLLLFWVCCSI